MGAGIPQTTVSSCTPTATGRSIAKRWMWHHRVPQGAFERLELLEGKLSRAVLRGLSGSNPARLPGGRGNVPGGDEPMRNRNRQGNAPYPYPPMVGQLQLRVVDAIEFPEHFDKIGLPPEH